MGVPCAKWVVVERNNPMGGWHKEMNMVKNTGEVVGNTSKALGWLLLDAHFFLEVIKAVSPNSPV